MERVRTRCKEEVEGREGRIEEGRGRKDGRIRRRIKRRNEGNAGRLEEEGKD